MNKGSKNQGAVSQAEREKEEVRRQEEEKIERKRAEKEEAERRKRENFEKAEEGNLHPSLFSYEFISHKNLLSKMKI